MAAAAAKAQAEPKKPKATRPLSPALPVDPSQKATGEGLPHFIAAPSWPSRYATGTAFVIETRFLLTNRHVVEDAQFVAIIDNAAEQPKLLGTQIVSRSREADLALLFCPGFSAPPLPIRVGDVARGTEVAAFGFPFGHQVQLTRGTVTALHEKDIGLFLIDAAINPGNSGGPVCDETGAVVGIATIKLLRESGLGAAIPMTTAVGFVKQSLRAFAPLPPAIERRTWPEIDQEVSQSVFQIIAAREP